MNIYDRADRIADRISLAIILLFVAYIAAMLVRAWLHYDAWKWMVQP